jgi:hypothetical protein
MQKPTHHYSQSASKISLSCSSPIIKINPNKKSPKVSPGESPSNYMIKNSVIDNNSLLFFNSSVTLKDLQRLAEIDSIAEEDDEHLSIVKHPLHTISKSASQKSFPLIPSEFPDIFHHEPRFVPISVVPVVLQKPPVRLGTQKREKRGKFDNELISFDRYSGLLKFYNFKKRNGFIKADQGDFDVFICEDDMVLSSQNLKKFKDDVYKNKPVFFEFNIKKYLNPKGEEKRKAVHVKIVEKVDR